MTKSHILWDHDGVLVDTERWYFEATRACIHQLGIELDAPDYLRDMAAGRSAWDRARERSERGLRSAVVAGIDCVVVASPFVVGQNFDLDRYRIETLRELPALLDSQV